MNKPSWVERNKLLLQFNLEDKSAIDFGCGDKSILDYVKFKTYIGLDKVETADIVIDLDRDQIPLTDKYDVGLVLGVLEYVQDDQKFLQSITTFSDYFIILVLTNTKMKTWHGWRRAYTEDSFLTILNKHFSSVQLHKYNKYIIAEARK